MVVSTLGMRSRDTLRARLDLEVVEGRGVDGFNSRNSRSSLALTLARSPERLVRKFGGVAHFMPSVRYSSSRAQVFTSTSLMRISVVVSTAMT